MDIAIEEGICLRGEVGLSGEIRPIARIDQRIAEAEKLGFKKIIIPAGQKISFRPKHIEILPVKKVAEAFRLILKN